MGSVCFVWALTSCCCEMLLAIVLIHVSLFGASLGHVLLPFYGPSSLLLPPSPIYSFGPRFLYTISPLRPVFTSSVNIPDEKSPPAVSPPTGITSYSSDCNDLETLINKERKRSGLASLGCDKGMRYVAYKHVTNQIDNNFQSGACFTSDFRNNKCMWDKPQELYGDARQGYEISAWNSGGMGAKKALEQWRGSQ